MSVVDLISPQPETRQTAVVGLRSYRQNDADHFIGDVKTGTVAAIASELMQARGPSDVFAFASTIKRWSKPTGCGAHAKGPSLGSLLSPISVAGSLRWDPRVSSWLASKLRSEHDRWLNERIEFYFMNVAMDVALLRDMSVVFASPRAIQRLGTRVVASHPGDHWARFAFAGEWDGVPVLRASFVFAKDAPVAVAVREGAVAYGGDWTVAAEKVGSTDDADYYAWRSDEHLEIIDPAGVRYFHV